jgi:hypothetical protein
MLRSFAAERNRFEALLLPNPNISRYRRCCGANENPKNDWQSNDGIVILMMFEADVSRPKRESHNLHSAL